MENRKKIAGILVMVILGLSLVAINASAQDANSLEGVWVHINPEHAKGNIVLSGNSFEIKFEEWRWQGTFTVNRNNITFNADDKSSWRTTFELGEDGLLVLQRGRGTAYHWGTFAKVDPEQRAYRAIAANTRATPLEGSWFHVNPESANARITFSGNSFSYTMDAGEKKGRFTLNGNNISLHADDGTSWITTYTITHFDGSNWVTTNSPVYDSWIVFEGGQSPFWWWGSFARIHQNATVEGTWKHPMQEARDATFTFSGNTFTYTRGGGVNRTGTFERTDTRLILTVNNRVVREYFYRFFNNGSQLHLYSVSGDGNTYYQGPFDKQ